VYRSVNSPGASEDFGTGTSTFTSAENVRGTIVARPEVHSIASGCPPGEVISTRAKPSGTDIGVPFETMSAQLGSAVALATGSCIEGAAVAATCQQTCVFLSSATGSGIDSIEIKFCFASDALADAPEGGVTKNMRYAASTVSGAGKCNV